MFSGVASRSAARQAREGCVRQPEIGREGPGDRRFRPDVEGLRDVAMPWRCSTTVG